MFAGSVFDLEPGTEYEARFVLSDPDGVDGTAESLVTVRTRVEPKPFAGGRTFHVYPPGYSGTRQEPAFTGLLAAYYTGSSNSDNHNTYPSRVQPGDTILVHAGLYKDNRFLYGGGGGLGTIFDGTYFLTQSGTADRPIAIKAAGDGEAIFDGDGAHNLFDVMAANYNYFEGLTIRNAEIAFLAGRKNIIGSSGLTIKPAGSRTSAAACSPTGRARRTFTSPTTSSSASRIRTSADRHRRAHVAEASKSFPPKLLSEFAVKVYGSGHVVALQLHRQLPRRHRPRHLRQPGRHAEPDPRSAAGVDRLLRQRHHQRGRQLHRGRRRGLQRPHLP